MLQVEIAFVYELEGDVTVLTFKEGGCGKKGGRDADYRVVSLSHHTDTANILSTFQLLSEVIKQGGLHICCPALLSSQ